MLSMAGPRHACYVQVDLKSKGEKKQGMARPSRGRRGLIYMHLLYIWPHSNVMILIPCYYLVMVKESCTAPVFESISCQLSEPPFTLSTPVAYLW